jgi:hypothetical protein
MGCTRGWTDSSRGGRMVAQVCRMESLKVLKWYHKSLTAPVIPNVTVRTSRELGHAVGRWNNSVLRRLASIQGVKVEIWRAIASRLNKC